MSRVNAILLLVAFALVPVPPAFSADPAPRTTPSVPARPATPEIDPATGLARSTVVRPLRDAPASPGAGSLPGAPETRQPIPEGLRPHIALILPIASPSLGRVADAVRQGFQAAAESAGPGAPPVTLMNVTDDGPALLEACRRARTQGALLVVAGITRDGASGVSRSDCPRIPVLTLNQPQDPELPANLYSISLSLESEARQAALLGVADGWHSAIVLSAPTALGKRVQEAFEKEWVRAAGEIGGRVSFGGRPDEVQAVKEKLANLKGDLVFLALDHPAALVVRPYISGMFPVYATSMSVDPRAEPTVNVDLQGVRYVDMPWFVQPDHPAVMVYATPRAPMSVEQERLYALGIDAYRLATVLLQGPTQRLALDGVTGRITLDGRQFVRTLTAAEVDGGRVVPIRPH